jgi:GntR family transcriptional regulator
VTPKVERVLPPFMQIAEAYRTQIREGALPQGARLPSIPNIALDAGVATATAAKAIRQLQREGYVRSTRQGTFVDLAGKMTSGADRLQMLRATGGGLRTGEEVEVTAAEMVYMSGDIADALAINDGGGVIRRRRVYRDGDGVIAVSTSWLPGALADTAPELLTLGPLPQMTFGLIEERTGRRASRRSDRVAIKAAPDDIAVHLEVPAGTPVLAMTNQYWDQNGDPIEYALDFLGAGRELSAEYNI